ncbi:Fur family transcriptional regulator [Denitromonas iodatirespirans]|uniref:Transcriptional repressor n=1 Tax=Denitromonas iodatirespirans TaxID=2795389 RepID=A0A944DG42_DENI1|nr:Fur family transcriptional regulator [Denitromonas iodatirespirans]MBT0962193.1 transcriptional repressor [Denitromonas iodatirespirans]
MTTKCLSAADGSEAFLNRAAASCEARGARLTPIRRDVLDLLLHNENGLKAYDLLARIKQIRRNATPPTVYRALDFLIEQGLVHKIERINQFVACRHESHRVPGLFLVCPRCGKVSELHDPALMQALAQSIAQAGHALDCHEVEISSVCPMCRLASGVDGEDGVPSGRPGAGDIPGQ